jgi:hypothetical protein
MFQIVEWNMLYKEWRKILKCRFWFLLSSLSCAYIRHTVKLNVRRVSPYGARRTKYFTTCDSGAQWTKCFTVRPTADARHNVTAVSVPPADRWGAHEEGVCRASEGGAQRRFVFANIIFNVCISLVVRLACGGPENLFAVHPISDARPVVYITYCSSIFQV